MTAITSCVGHVPRFRIATDAIRERWGGGSKGVGAKAVGAKDDDAVTLAIEAGRLALDGRTDAGALVFASTTLPYQHGEVGPMIVEALDLPAETHTTTVGASDRAGTAALRSALDYAEVHDEPALVVASEVPHPKPDTDQEKTAGAGAAATLVEPDETGLVPIADSTHTKPMLEEWEAPGGARRSGDDRFGRDVGYVDTTATAIGRALDDAGRSPGDVDCLVVSQPTAKFHWRLAKSLGVDSDVLAAPDLAANYGDLGSGSPLAGLSTVDVDTGDLVVVAGYGSGIADAVAFDVRSVPSTTPLEVESPVELSYLDYLEHTDNL